jgi:CubicO group peptidase (beta-lactamase class C family)
VTQPIDQAPTDAATRARPLDASHWQERLATLATRHHVPGAQLGILRLSEGGTDEVVEAVHGVLSLRTAAPVTSDAIFQIGSITKAWTATVVMQLVDEGLLELDAPVARILPDLRLAQAEVARSVTLRHLLTHTSGIDGDVFTDTGRGDECLERYVGLLADVAQNHPLGATWSYCNSGYSLLGRIIEVVTGGTWDKALREHLFTPLGLTNTVTLPEEALLYGAAVGHVEDDGQQRVAPAWCLPRSLGPAGLIVSSAADVLAFARLHLTGGLAADGRRLLSEASAAAMASRQADLPDPYILGDSWGLGWIRFGWDGHRLIGHDGNTIGQAAFLRLLPEQGLAVTLLTNGGQDRDLYEDLYREVFEEVAGVRMPLPLTPPDPALDVDVSAHVGTYERASVRLEVLAPDGEHATPRLRTTITGPLAELEPEPTKEYPMLALGSELFLVRPPEAETWFPVTFYTLPTGERYLHFGARATRRVS